MCITCGLKRYWNTQLTCLNTLEYLNQYLFCIYIRSFINRLWSTHFYLHMCLLLDAYCASLIIFSNIAKLKKSFEPSQHPLVLWWIDPFQLLCLSKAYIFILLSYYSVLEISNNLSAFWNFEPFNGMITYILKLHSSVPINFLVYYWLPRRLCSPSKESYQFMPMYYYSSESWHNH